MKNKVVLILLLISSLTLSQVKSPKIFAPEETHNFGDIKEGGLLNYNFVVKNTGNEDLKINMVRASCGCTAAEPAKNVLLPGDSTNIMVTFNSARRSGLQRKHVYVYSNDPENPQMRLSFTANVVSNKELQKMASGPIIYFPSNRYNYGTVQAGTIVTGKLKFSNSGKSTLRIDRLEPSAKYIVVNVDKRVLSPGSSGELSIKFNSLHRTGKITRTVTVYSNDPRNPRQIITLYINIVPKEK